LLFWKDLWVPIVAGGLEVIALGLGINVCKPEKILNPRNSKEKN
jgi:hypothetical protein